MHRNSLALTMGLSLSIPLGAAPNAQPIDRDWGNITILDITDKAEIDSRINQFTKDFAAIGVMAEVLSCRGMIGLPVPTGRGNISYGAVCIVKFQYKTHTVGLCDDDMVGHFSILTDLTKLADTIVPGILDRNNLAWFTLRNCYGG